MQDVVIAKKLNLVLKPVILIELLYWGAFLISLMIKCFYFQFATRLNVWPVYSPVNRYMLLASFAVLLVIVGFSGLVSNKNRLAVIFGFNIFLTVLLVADTLYFRYFLNAITIPVLYEIRYAGAVRHSATSLLKIKDIVYIIDIPFFAAAMIIMYKKHVVLKINMLKRIAAALVIMVIGAVVIRAAYSKVDSSLFRYDNNFAITRLGILYFHYYDTVSFIKENLLQNRVLSSEEKAMLKDFYKSKEIQHREYKGAAKGKNLILIQVEAFQNFLINCRINGREITPNLNRLSRESLYFDNFYYQIGGGNTSDAEFIVNTSLYPLSKGAVGFRFPVNTYVSLPEMLKQKGYDTYVFHANVPSFWNRDVMFKNLGFDNFISKKDFIQDSILGWGLADVSFFKQSLDMIDTSKPFYSQFITLSSHHPFNSFEKYNFDVGKYNGTIFGNYIKAANYDDYAISKFITGLKEKGIYDRSVIVIYGDHFGLSKEQAGDALKYLGIRDNDLEWMKFQKVPCIISCPGVIEAGTVDTTGGQIDLLPTLANMMGFEAPYAVGKDLLNTDKGYAVLRNGNVVTDDYIYLNSKKEAYDIKTGELLEKKNYDAQLQGLLNELKMSDLIIMKDAMKYFGSGN